MNQNIINLAVFVSGSGTNFTAIQEGINNNSIAGKIRLLISSNDQAKALEKAKVYSIPAYVFDPKKYADPVQYEKELFDLLINSHIDFILLAGYLKKIPDAIVKHYSQKILNIHPALLPKFGGKGMYGIHVHEAVLQAGEKETGVTIHFVDEHYDNGPIIIQERVAVLPGDTPQTLQQRVLKLEHSLYPYTVKLLCENKIKVINNRVQIEK